MCGGTVLSAKFMQHDDGLSPRVRGNLCLQLPCCSQARSIPACAGEPLPDFHRAFEVGVYPRVCGGTRPSWPRSCCGCGLSPRVRGNRGDEAGVGLAIRSIPACAGEPGAIKRSAWNNTVYPRVCGGTRCTGYLLSISLGLSPRVRGNPRILRQRPAYFRSIPACAGEPPLAAVAYQSPQVYPRVCGGTEGELGYDACSHGLSPRVRGNPPTGVKSSISAGSIPACAGEPVRNPFTNSLSRVYPRVCGGTSTPISMTNGALGLSPRVRGNRIGPPLQYALHRSIPACAGEP